MDPTILRETHPGLRQRVFDTICSFSSIRQPIYRLGRLATELLLD